MVTYSAEITRSETATSRFIAYCKDYIIDSFSILHEKKAVDKPFFHIFHFFSRSCRKAVLTVKALSFFSIQKFDPDFTV